MSAALIIGASRGIGYEFVRQYRADGWRVIATARDEAALERLHALGAEAYPLDLLNMDDIASLSRTLDGEKLDLCIHNAGVMGPNSGGFATPAEADFNFVMQTNVLSAMRLIPVVIPQVIAARGKMVFLSSRMGSISAMSGPNAVLYRSSKSALNAVVKAAVLQWGRDGATLAVLHPGWVRTEMGGAGADIEIDVSVSGLRKVIAGLTAQQSGQFFDYSGAEIGW